MISLNLLPSQKKQEIQTIEIFSLLKNLIILILFITIIIAILLLLAKLSLQNFFNDVVDNNTLTTRNIKIYNEDINDFNQKLNAVEKIQADYLRWSQIIIALTQLIPNNTVVTDLTINKEKIVILGLAKNRQDLLNLKNNLENSDILKNVVIPLENLLQKENISFSIKADIKSESLKTYGI
jgi:Tfp pilus assembly protein PilN